MLHGRILLPYNTICEQFAINSLTHWTLHEFSNNNILQSRNYGVIRYHLILYRFGHTTATQLLPMKRRTAHRSKSHWSNRFVKRLNVTSLDEKGATLRTTMYLHQRATFKLVVHDLKKFHWSQKTKLHRKRNPEPDQHNIEIEWNRDQ